MRQYRDYHKVELSDSTNGKCIKITATASPGTDIHTALANVAKYEFDEVHLWAINTDSSAHTLTVQWGGTTSPDDEIKISLAAITPTKVIDGALLQSGLVVKAFADAANVVNVYGYVNRHQHDL